MIAMRNRLMCATSVFALSCFTTSLAAQNAPDLAADLSETTEVEASNVDTGGAIDLGTLIFGELRTRTLQESVTSAVVETGQELEERGDVDIYDVVERAPNVSTTFGNKGFVLRGIQANGAVSNVQLNGTLVSVQVDGVALNNYQSTFFGPYSSWDLEQVEILRGPQSTQQGRNALAGALIINSRDPEFFPEYRFRVEGGSRNTQRYAMSLNQPVGETVALRFSAESSSTDGYVTSRTLDDDAYDQREYDSYRAKLRWAPSNAFDAVLEYSYTDSTGGEDYVLDSEFPASRVTDQDADAVEGSVHESFAFSTRYEFDSGLVLETETNYYEQDYTRLEGLADPLGVAESRLSIDGGSQTFEQDVKLTFETDRVKGVAGLFYTDTSDSRPLFTTTDLAVAGFPGVVDTVDQQFDTEVKNTAIYAEADFDMGDWVPGLSITAGARYDSEEYTYTQSVDFGAILNGTPPFGAGLPDVAENSASRDFTAFLPKLGATYEFDDAQSLSFTIQRGYRAGGTSNNFITVFNPFVESLSNYDPEYSTNYELAYRGSFNDDRLRVSGNIFYTKWDDMQISVPGVPTIPALDPLFNFDTVNAAESELYGFELAFESEPSDNLALFGSVGYTKTKFIEFDPDPATPGDFNGNEFPFSPDWTATLGGKYTWDNGFALAVDASYKSASFQDNANTYTDDDRWLVNLHGTYDISENVTAGLYVRNLFDEDYATARFRDPNGISPTIIRTGEPRTVGLYMQAEF